MSLLSEALMLSGVGQEGLIPAMATSSINPLARVHEQDAVTLQARRG